MRPQAVRSAEAIYLASIVLMVVLAWMTWDQLVARAGVGAAFGANAIYVGLSLLLLILTTRRASRFALWALIVLTALNLAGLAWQVWDGVLVPGLLGVLIYLQAGLTLVGAVLLFRPLAREWFARAAGPREVDA